MRKVITAIMIMLLAFSSFCYSEAENNIKLIGNIVTEGNSNLMLVDSGNFKISWEKDSNAVSYEVSFTSSDLEINENIKATEFEIKNLKENDRGFFNVKGLDKSGNEISKSPSLIIAYPPSESKSLSLEKPSNKVLTKDNYDDFFESNFSFNYVSGMEKFKIRIFSADKVYRERLQIINMGTFPKDLDDGLDKKITVEVSAIAGDKVISSESFEINYFNDAKSNYGIKLSGYDQNKPYWSNKVRIDILDNHNELDKGQNTFYKVEIKNIDSGATETLYSLVSNDGYENGYVSSELKNGAYEVSVEAIKPLTYKDGFDETTGHSLDELMENLKTSETLGRDVLSINVLGESSAIYAPSVWARNSVDNIIRFVPNELNSNYSKSITRQEVCRVLVPLHKDFSSTYYLPISGVFKDTEDPYVSIAYSSNIVKGKSENIFDPSGNITREEFAVIITNVCKSLGQDVSVSGELKFKDKASISTWAQGSVNYLASNKIFNGSPDGKFNPKNSITREEAFVVINNVMNYLNGKREY